MTSLTIATLFPLDTVAAGDQANGPGLVRRARQRGIEATLTTVNRPETLVPADIYLLGGDGLAGVGDLVAHLKATRVADEVQAGQATVLAVDAGLAAVGRSWTDRDGVVHDGLGIVGSTVRASPPAAVTIGTRPAPGLGLPAMVGWHGQAFTVARDPGVDHLAELVADPVAGNRPEVDGVLSRGVIGTQLHGPVLALNPELADLVLAMALGVRGWDPLPVPSVGLARSRRIAELTGPSQPARRRPRFPRLRQRS